MTDRIQAIALRRWRFRAAFIPTLGAALCILLLGSVAPLEAQPPAVSSTDTLPGAVRPTALTAQRLTPGARIRLSRSDGVSVDARFIAMQDTALQISVSATGSPERVALADLRSLEVHAPPSWRGTAAGFGAFAGAILGAMAGAAAHGTSGEGGQIGLGDPPSKAENITVGALYGGLFGWAIGRYAIGRARWQCVFLPK